MPTAVEALTLFERNTETIDITATLDGAPFDLTGLDIEVIVKASAQALDTDGTILSSATGDVVVTDPTGGLATVTIPGPALTTPGKKRFLRADAINAAGERRTIAYTVNLIIVDL